MTNIELESHFQMENFAPRFSLLFGKLLKKSKNYFPKVLFPSE